MLALLTAGCKLTEIFHCYSASLFQLVLEILLCPSAWQCLRRNTSRKILGPQKFFRGFLSAFEKCRITMTQVLSWSLLGGKCFCVTALHYCVWKL